jgi:hypothetical protein
LLGRRQYDEGRRQLGIAAAVIDDCYHLATDFPKVIFGFCNREADNTAAHKVARVARGAPEQVWLDKPPEFLIPLLLDDVTCVSNE